MAEKRSEKKWMVILVVLIALSLVVDLLSLNMLYNILKSDSGLKGKLAMSAGAYFCVLESCSEFSTEEECESMALIEYEDCVRGETVTTGQYSYILPSDITFCREFALDVEWACNYDREECIKECEEEFPEEYTPPSPIKDAIYDYYKYYSNIPV